MNAANLNSIPAMRGVRFRCVLPVLFFVFIIVGCKSEPKLTPEQAAGKHLFDVRCAHCHEDNDLALKPPPPDIHGVFKRAKLPSGAPATDEQIEDQLIKGKGNMPSFAGRFDEEQTKDLLIYLHQIY